MSKKLLKFYNLGGFGADPGMDRLLAGAGYAQASNSADADIIVFNGGQDVGTSLYGERPILSYIPEAPSDRDKYEHEVFDTVKGSKFTLGICRGAQFLNVMNGGTLWQDVDKHGRDHTMLDLVSGLTYRATSTHHQMMRPNFNIDNLLVGVASEATVRRRDGETQNINPKTNPDLDVEIMWYPGNRSLCIQGHPEYVPGSEFADYCLGLVGKFYRE
ncbi:MAG: hypothetical protein B7Z80_02695 [Rhodospirillales bacterium 20-64-7]|nr:MAG: hypothetical protein B7Z80_02695 [Rhodospirillales bacterium 20-64-7]